MSACCNESGTKNARTLILEFKEKPSLFGAYVNIFTPGRAKYAGVENLPPLQSHWLNATESPAKIQAYREACGLDNDGKLPLLYPHILTSAMHIHMLADKRFPASALGAVHARNHIVQHRPIIETESVDLHCYFNGARVLKAGLEVDIATTVSSNNEHLWESISSYLFLGRKFGDIGPAHSWSTFEELGTPSQEADWSVPADMGRRYAKITGDYNPIHVSKLLAKIFGFKRDLIHGMWSLARCLAHLPLAELEGAVRLDVAFKGPVYMQSKVNMKAEPIASGHRFDLFCQGNDRPCICAKIQSASSDATLVEA